MSFGRGHSIVAHHRLVEIAGNGDAAISEVVSMAQELMRVRTQVEMLKMDLERAIKLAESLQNGH